ncbi:KAD9 kinase, partial [Grallaria varia]|nr:KAD9 kinase [Grallaria varia]
GMSEITADHPEVQMMVEEAIKNASVSEATLSPQIYAEVLEGAIAELMKENKDRFPGAPEKGGWVVDNYPLSVDHWSALSKKGLLPDTVVCLKSTEKDGYCPNLSRFYLATSLSRLEYIAAECNIINGTTNTTSSFKAHKKIFSCSSLESQQATKMSLQSIMYRFAEDNIPDTEEINAIKKKIELFMHDWQTVESEIKNSSLVQVVVLEIAEQTPESLLNQTVLVMERPFKYYGWELSAEDLEEEAEDLAAEEENEEDEEEEE